MNDNYSDLEAAEKQNVMGQPGSWIMGAVLIGVGGLLLLRNLTGFDFDNWWVLFWLIPLGGLLTGIWNQYQASGRINPGLIIGATVMVFMIAVFLFNLSWGALWPIFLIFGGISALLGSRNR